MSLDLLVLIPSASQTYEQALNVYYEEEEADLVDPGLQAYADEVDARFTNDDWPFGGDPLMCGDHVSLVVVPERWGVVVPELVAMAHRRGLGVLDPQE